MVYSCDCLTRDHSAVFLRNDAPVFYCIRVAFRCDDDIRIHVLVSCGVHRNGVLLVCDTRLAYDTRLACDILVCAYDIPVFCYNLHDMMMVVYRNRNDVGLASLHDVAVDSVVAHDELDNEVYVVLRDEPGNVACAPPRDVADSRAYALPCILDNVVAPLACHVLPELVLPTQLPIT